MKFTEHNSTVIQSYDSCAEAISRIMEVYDAKCHRCNFLVTRTNRRANFVGRRFSSEKEWLQYMQQGDDEVAKTIDGIKRRIRTKMDAPKVIRKRRRKLHESEGEEVLMENLFTGNPYWISMTGESLFNKRRVISLIIPSGMNYTSHSSVVTLQVAAGLTATEILESNGYSVELWCSSYVINCYRKGGCRNSLVNIRLKSSRSPLNIQSLSSFSTGSFYRTGYFVLSSYSDNGLRDADESLGFPRLLNKKVDWSLISKSIGSLSKKEDVYVLKLVERYDEEFYVSEVQKLLDEINSHNPKKG